MSFMKSPKVSQPAEAPPPPAPEEVKTLEPAKKKEDPNKMGTRSLRIERSTDSGGNGLNLPVA